MYIESIDEAIGNTPILKLRNVSKETGNNILGKCEFLNPLGSVKDRIGQSMIKDALESGKIKENTILIEPTSGNTGIALAYICASLNIKLQLVMPESMSIERRKILKAFGAELILTPKERGMKGAVDKANDLLEITPNSISPAQFDNPANPKVHEETTVKEILKDLDGKIDIFVASVGTGGTITGIGRALKKHNPDIKIIAVEPVDSAVLSGEKPGLHKIQGIGAGFIPSILDTTVYDEIFKVTNEDSFRNAKNIAKEEGVFVGISSGANIYAAQQIAKRYQDQGKTIVTMLCDTGERYLSTTLFDD